MMPFVLMTGIGLLIYCITIKLGHHTVSFNRYLFLLASLLCLVSLVDVFHIYDYPHWLEIMIFSGVVLMIIGTIYLMAYAKKRQHHSKPSLIFVFGAGLIENRISLSLKTRLDKAYELAYLYPTSRILVSGGQGKNELLSEAKAMKDYLVMKGIDEERILMEDKSTSTQENLVFSMKKYDLSCERIAFVSNQFHVFRIEKMAKKLGLHGFGVPSYMKNIGTLAFYIRECFACVKAILKREI